MRGKRILQRLTSLFLAFVLVLGMVPGGIIQTVYAATSVSTGLNSSNCPEITFEVGPSGYMTVMDTSIYETAYEHWEKTLCAL